MEIHYFQLRANTAFRFKMSVIFELEVETQPGVSHTLFVYDHVSPELLAQNFVMEHHLPQTTIGPLSQYIRQNIAVLSQK